jgi:hypothetical protein
LLDTAQQFEYINEAIYQRGAMSYLLKDTATAYRDWKAAQDMMRFQGGVSVFPLVLLISH